MHLYLYLDSLTWRLRELINMLKKRILAKGYPLTDPTYPVAHMLASKEELHKFGKTHYEHLNTISQQHPNQLLGTHHGNKIDWSSIVPKKEVPEVKFHEKREIYWMRKLKSKK